jgi:hypothetical protein
VEKEATVAPSPIESIVSKRESDRCGMKADLMPSASGNLSAPQGAVQASHLRRGSAPLSTMLGLSASLPDHLATIPWVVSHRMINPMRTPLHIPVAHEEIGLFQVASDKRSPTEVESLQRSRDDQES